MITFFRHNAFKYLLLMILSLKIGSFLYENLSSINNSEKISFIVDFEENENEKKELDENEKIHQSIEASIVQIVENGNNKPFSNSSELRTWYFEYTTPPPELI